MAALRYQGKSLRERGPFCSIIEKSLELGERAMNRFVIAGILAVMSFAIHAEIFKCQVNGRTVYQQQPCSAGTARGTIEVRDDVSDNTANENRKKFEVSREGRIANDRAKAIDRQIKSKMYEIDGYKQSMDNELARLNERLELVRAERAGPAFEQSISSEMEVVVAKYAAKIKFSQDEIDALRKERTGLAIRTEQ